MSKTNYVDEQMLHCIRQNGNYPQDVQYSKTIWLTFGTIGLTVNRAYPKKTMEKHINGWREMTAKEINEALSVQSFKDAD